MAAITVSAVITTPVTAYGLDAVNWETANFLPDVRDLLMLVYDDIDDIDLWIGGLAEVHVDGGMLGELFAAIVADQFIRAA